MKNAKETSVKKSIRVPESVVTEIETEASESNMSFSDVVNYRLKHFEAPLTPAIMCKVQNIANRAVDIAKDASPEQADKIQEEVSALWNYLK